MNWLQKINNVPLTITTGDRKEHTPLWRNAIKNITFNTEGFDFINKDGSFVARKRRSGRRFPILLYFQGEDHLEQASRFEESANDSRPWRIKHPYYDTIFVQPLDLKFDNTEHNVTKVTGTVWETMLKKYPSEFGDTESSIQKNKKELDTTIAEEGANDLKEIDTDVIEDQKNVIEDMRKGLQKYVQAIDEVQNIENEANKALSDTNNIVSDTFTALSSTQGLINSIVDNDLIKITDKIDAFKTVINDLKNRLLGDDKTSISEKLYEAQISTTLSAASYSAVLADYDNRDQVTATIEAIDDLYFDFVVDFDSLETDQNANIAKGLDSIIYSTLSNLYNVAYNARQTRRFVTDKQTNIVILAHEFYGPGDEKLNEFISQNNITLEEHIQIKKGREIIYFV